MKLFICLLSLSLSLIACSKDDSSSAANKPKKPEAEEQTTVKYKDIDLNTKVLSIKAGSKLVFTYNVPDFYQAGVDSFNFSKCARLALSWNGERIGLYKTTSRLSSIGSEYGAQVNFCPTANSFEIVKGKYLFESGMELVITKLELSYSNSGTELLKISFEPVTVAIATNMLGDDKLVLSHIEIFGDDFANMYVDKLLKYHLWSTAKILVKTK